jgi:hypothetical protein
MTIGTPLWDEFVKNLKEVKLTVEDMGFMPTNIPSDKELQNMTAEQKSVVEQEFRNYYKCYAETCTKVVHNNMFVNVEKVNEEVRSLYYSNYVNLEVILNKIGDDFLKYIINMSELCDIKKIRTVYLDPLVKYKITAPSNAIRYNDYLCRIGMEYIYCVNFLTDSFDSRVFNEAQKKEIKRMILHSADVLEENISETPTVIDMENKFKEKIEALRNEIKSRQLPAEFADYFIAPFKGIGNGNINYYKRLEENLTDASRERSVIEYAKIALLIYNSKKMSAKKPQTFSEWYQYFCKIVGCEYNKDYKPSKLQATESLEREFYFLLS